MNEGHENRVAGPRTYIHFIHRAWQYAWKHTWMPEPCWTWHYTGCIGKVYQRKGALSTVAKEDLSTCILCAVFKRLVVSVTETVMANSSRATLGDKANNHVSKSQGKLWPQIRPAFIDLAHDCSWA